MALSDVTSGQAFTTAVATMVRSAGSWMRVSMQVVETSDSNGH